MIDTKEIIRVLGFVKEYFDNHAEEQEPDVRKELFMDWVYTVEEAITLLKAQEPRVMTLEEVQQHNNQDGCVWFEQPSYNAVAAFVAQDGEEFTELISPYLLGLPINHRCMVNRFYGLTWRCWTSRPTNKQMEAIPWN